MRTLVLVRPKVVLGLNNFDIAWITNVTTFMRSHVEVSKDLGLLLSGVFEIHEQKSQQRSGAAWNSLAGPACSNLTSLRAAAIGEKNPHSLTQVSHTSQHNNTRRAS
jgi:hypothetical protein